MKSFSLDSPESPSVAPGVVASVHCSAQPPQTTHSADDWNTYVVGDTRADASASSPNGSDATRSPTPTHSGAFYAQRAATSASAQQQQQSHPSQQQQHHNHTDYLFAGQRAQLHRHSYHQQAYAADFLHLHAAAGSGFQAAAFEASSGGGGPMQSRFAHSQTTLSSVGLSNEPNGFAAASNEFRKCFEKKRERERASRTCHLSFRCELPERKERVRCMRNAIPLSLPTTTTCMNQAPELISVRAGSSASASSQSTSSN